MTIIQLRHHLHECVYNTRTVMDRLKIGLKHLIGEDNPTFIIAEIGQNHQGDLKIAKELIRVAKECGADCVKFQKTCIPEKFNKNALARPYSTTNSWGQTYGEHKKHLEFSEEEFRQLQAFATEMDIILTASAMDSKSLDFLESIRVPVIKIGSGDSNNLVLIEKAASKNIPLIISTGMQDLDGVRRIYQSVSKFHKKFALLHCVSAYPTPLEDVNLNVINLYKKEFADIPIGYSGHELGTHISLAAVALGAKIVERHITLDKKLKGSDHKCSLEPEEFKSLISNIRELELALGKPVKEFKKSEYACYEKLGKTIVAAHSLLKGTIIEMDDLKIKVAEPKGLDASLISSIIGKCLQVDLDEDESMTEDCLKFY